MNTHTHTFPLMCEDAVTQKNLNWIKQGVCVCFQVYMYAAWKGWVIPMFLFLAILRLSLNYLIAKSVSVTYRVRARIRPTEHSAQNSSVLHNN